MIAIAIIILLIVFALIAVRQIGSISLQAGAGTKELIALAAGSTIAGNLPILGAASNIIIIQNAEKKSKETINFLEFAKIGIPLTIANLAIYWIFLNVIP